MARVKVSGVIFGLFHEGMGISKKVLIINDSLPSIPFKENLENSVEDLFASFIKEDSPFLHWNVSDIVADGKDSLTIIIACIVPNTSLIIKEGNWLTYEELSEEMQGVVYSASNKV